MPSRVVALDAANTVPAGVPRELEIVPAGNSCTQITVNTLPDTAAGLVGLKAGRTGDAVRLNREGAVFTLSGADARGGLWMTSMPDGVPAGIVEFAIVAPDGA